MNILLTKDSLKTDYFIYIDLRKAYKIAPNNLSFRRVLFRATFWTKIFVRA